MLFSLSLPTTNDSWILSLVIAPSNLRGRQKPKLTFRLELPDVQQQKKPTFIPFVNVCLHTETHAGIVSSYSFLHEFIIEIRKTYIVAFNQSHYYVKSLLSKFVEE